MLERLRAPGAGRAAPRAGLRVGRRRVAGRLAGGTARSRPPHHPAKARASSSSTWTAARRRSTRSTPSRCSTSEHGQPVQGQDRADAVQQRRQRAGVALEVPPVRPERHAGQRPVPARRPSASTTWRRPLDVVELLRAHQRQLLPAHRRGCRAGRAWGRGSRYGLGSECQDLPGFIVLNGGLIPPGGLDNFNSGFLPAAYQGSIFQPGDPPVANIAPTRADRGRPAAASSTCCARSTAACSAGMGHHDSLEVGHRQLRAGLPDADGRARADRPRRRDGGDAAAVRPRRSVRRRRGSSPASACSPGGWSSAACGSSS